MPDATNKQYETRVGYIYHLMVKNIQTVSSSEVRDLPIQRRRCRYFDEPESVGIPHYTYKLCTMKCRRKLAIKLCGCSPPFYRQLNRPGNHWAFTRTCITVHLTQSRSVSAQFPKRAQTDIGFEDERLC